MEAGGARGNSWSSCVEDGTVEWWLAGLDQQPGGICAGGHTCAGWCTSGHRLCCVHHGHLALGMGCAKFGAALTYDKPLHCDMRHATCALPACGGKLSVMVGGMAFNFMHVVAVALLLHGNVKFIATS